MSHTPGKWAVHEHHDLSLAELHGVSLGHPKSREHGVFGVYTDDGDGNGSPLPIERWEADASLIAAAPDLLEACEALLGVFSGDFTARDPDIKASIDKARAAIAKAKS